MAEFALNAQQTRWVEIARTLAKTFGKRARHFDEAGVFPREDMDDCKAAGLLKLAVPREYGGEGGDAGFCDWLPHLVVEAIATESGGTAWCLLTHFHGCGMIAGVGSDEQKRRYFREVVEKGALIASVGSEVMPQQMKSSVATAGPLIDYSGLKLVPGGLSATGKKGFTSTAKEADYMVLWGRAPRTEGSSDGMTLSVVPVKSDGVGFLPGWEEAIGIRSSESGGAELNDVFIPWTNVMGQPGDVVQNHPYPFEISYGWVLLGLSQGALNFIQETLASREYLQEDDHAINAFGEMLSDLQATRASLWYAQWLWQQGDFGEATDASLCAQNQAKRAAIRIATQGFEVVGVRGLFKFNPLERIWRDIRTVTLHTRESQLMRLVSEGALKGNKFPKKKYGKQIKERKTWEQLISEADGQPTPPSQIDVNA